MVCGLKKTRCEDGETDRPREVERGQSHGIEGKIRTTPGLKVEGDGNWGKTGIGRGGGGGGGILAVRVVMN